MTRRRGSVKVQVRGAEKLIKELKAIGKAAKKVNRAAIRKAIRPIRRAVKAEAPVDMGLLKKAIAEKVYTRKGSMITTGMVGADKSVTGPNGEQPWRYDHLVHDGYTTEDGRTVAGNPYMQRGYNRTKSEAEAIYANEIKAGIEKVKTGGGGKKK